MKNRFIFSLPSKPPSAIIPPMKLKSHQVTKAIVRLYEKEISALKMEIRILKLRDEHGLLPFYQTALESIQPPSPTTTATKGNWKNFLCSALWLQENLPSKPHKN
jgi:hypothetical protein